MTTKRTLGPTGALACGLRAIRIIAAALALFPAIACAALPELTLSAIDFDEGNVRISRPGQEYAGAHACIWNAGELPNRVEYQIELPIAADYTLSALYAANEPRPVDIGLDGKKVHTGFNGVTGNWNTDSAKWDKQCTLHMEPGKHTISLLRQGPFPHICALRIDSPTPFAEGQQFRTPSAEDRARRTRLKASLATLRAIDVAAVRLAVDDLAKEFPDRYDAVKHRQMLAGFEQQRDALFTSAAEAKPADPESVDRLLGGVRSALLANPLLDFDKLLVVRRNFPPGRARSATGEDVGFVGANYLNHTAMPRGGWDNEITSLSGLRGQPRFDRLYRAEGGKILRDIRLDFPADRMLFSSIGQGNRWALFEIQSDGTGLRQLTPTEYPDLDYFDGCWLSDGRIIVCATGSYAGLPCLEGNGQIASLYLLDPGTKRLRQLTFDQDSDNDPTILNDGRVMYQRWEYSDIPHYFSRRRFSMNPDGTGQISLYGSNSWFPTAFRFARTVPDHPTRLVGIISGHHDFGDCGRMAILDPGLAGGYPFRYRPTSREWGPEGQPIAVTPDVLPASQTGFLQLIPGHGRTVAGTVCDAIVSDVYRKQNPALVTHPFPLSSKYFLVSMKPTPQSLWGIYLVDIFDNATLIAEAEGAALFEPTPLLARPRPPIIPDRIVTGSRTATVHIADIYQGPGLRGVPRGTVKNLRVFSYHFGYNAKAGFPFVGTQSGWDVKRILGTATVESDGSALFQIPANTPISIQPLDEEGRAVQLMRSWLVGMPGEHVSCVGCHEDRRVTLPPQRTQARDRAAETLKPWYGAARPFAFAHEVFPILEKYCIGCHDSRPTVGPRSKPSFKTPDLAYDTLHPYVHRPGVESDMALLNPMEYHASTSALVQMLEKGHHGVTLAAMDREARDRIYCWIDLNVPKSGRWNPPAWQNYDQRQRRVELAKLFAENDADPEAEDRAADQAFARRAPVQFVKPPAEEPTKPDGLSAPGFPMTREDAQRLQQSGRASAMREINLGGNVKMTLAWIPAGAFVMGSLDGAPDERPRAVVRVDRPFWMAVTEITNAQYALFDPAHDTRYIDMHSLDRVVPGHIANHPDQPAGRLSWDEAMRFCDWISRKTGLRVTLPSESQWEWAARAGSDGRFFYGGMETDFGRFANLADQALRWYKMGYDGPSALQRRSPYPLEMNFPLHDERFRDKWFVVDYVGQCEPNAWGLKDMVGNVSEWTRSAYRPYPYADNDGRNDDAPRQRRVARGGSWADRPADAGSATRRAYEPWQKVYDVGFRVIVEEKDKGGSRE